MSHDPAAETDPPPSIGGTAQGGEPEAALAATRSDGPGDGCPVVGIGASAGGLQAFTEVLEQLTPAMGVAFVLVQHLDPRHESQLSQLLDRVTPLPVSDAADGMRVLPDHVYVIPPNTRMTIAGGILRVAPRETGVAPVYSIDAFFTSLAEDRGSGAIGVVLSGSGSDGTAGLGAIKAAGGITFAQQPGSAGHPSMPCSAIASGCVDFILPPPEIATEIARIGSHAYLHVRSEVVADDAVEPDAAFAAIVELVRSQTKVDFGHYRPSMIKRRILRRMAIDGYTEPGAYLDYLEHHRERATSLLKDILVNVTGFFRDDAVFSGIGETAMQSLATDPGGAHVIRLWIVGCSTGQEVYSLAIELLEASERQASQPRIEIFATDISEEVLGMARVGIYPASIEAEVSPERLRRWFCKVPEGYQIVKSIRDLCLFARHDVTLDIPFSKIDLLSCRNVLIYMSASLQERVVSTFHYALKPNGLLLLGAAETVGRLGDLFALVDQTQHLYRRRTGTTLRIPGPHPAVESATFSRGGVGEPRPPTLTELQRAADRIVLARFAPAGVLIDENRDILQFRGDTGPFLGPSQGRASLGLLKMLPRSLGKVVSDAIDEAQDSRLVVRRENVPLRGETGLRRMNLQVVPVRHPATTGGCFLILFELAATLPPEETGSPHDGVEVDRERERLRRELGEMEDYLQTLVDDAADAQEQRREALEDATSSNEELRCANEELQTTKEELESTNEELLTVNEELRSRNQELNNSNERIAEAAALSQAVIETVRDPLLVLGDDFRVELANPAFYALFRIQDGVVLGRPIHRVDSGQWDLPELRRLLDDLAESDRCFDGLEVTHDFPRIGTRTMRLYARGLHRSAGRPSKIVLVMADVTEEVKAHRIIKEAALDLSRSNAQLEHFAHIASHDLQAPLRVATSNLDFLQHHAGLDLDDQARNFLDRAVAANGRMRVLITGILQHAKAGSDSMCMTRVETAELLRTVLEDVDLEDPATRIQAERLPVVVADALMLRQVFQNLVVNAVKYRAAGRSSVIRITAARGPDHWTFAFTDNGIGIAPEHTERVFSLFERSNVSRDRPGCGIGLATCKQIIERHGGRMWLESTVDQGTTVSFTLPERPVPVVAET